MRFLKERKYFLLALVGIFLYPTAVIHLFPSSALPEDDSAQEIRLTPTPVITEARAVAAASIAQPGWRSVKTELELEKGGPVYEVVFLRPHQAREVTVDAKAGKVLFLQTLP